VKTIALIKSIQDGSYKKSLILPTEIEPHEIMSIKDFEVLKRIASHRDDFDFLRKTETWPNRDDRQFVLGSMDRLCKFLRDIESKTCRCALYKYTALDPELEAAVKNITIAKATKDDYQADYECICTSCNSAFVAIKQEVRFGQQTLWLEK
jgi:hypothetical protein